MKTVLAPGAPWPVYEKPKPKPKPKFKPKVIGKQALIDMNFEKWLKENNELHKSNKSK